MRISIERALFMHKPVILVVAVLLLVGQASASDNGRAFAFARANAERFTTEVTEVQGIQLGSKITVQGALDSLDFSFLQPTYDPAAGELVIQYRHAEVGGLQLSEVCKSAGAYTGQNAYGVRMRVQRQRCERFFVRDGDVRAASIAGSRIKMTPAQFRDLIKKGVRAEVDFLVGHPKSNVIVSFSDTVEGATLSHAFETYMKVWTISGRVLGVRWILPIDGQQVTVWPPS